LVVFGCLWLSLIGLGITQEELKATHDELASTQETLTDTVLVLDDRETCLVKTSGKATSSLNTGTEASKL
jgi:hypothetical protein